MSEGDKNINGEGQDQEHLKKLQAQIDELNASLEAEKKSKERILEESKKYKEGYQSFKSEKEELERKKQAEREELLKKEGNFQTIIEQREADIAAKQQAIEELESKLAKKDTAILNFKKAAAFESALGGKMKNSKYWDLVDFDTIALNPETGKIDEASLKQSVDNFLDDHKGLVDLGKGVNLPNHGGNRSSGKLTHEQWKKLPLKERKSRMKDVVI